MGFFLYNVPVAGNERHLTLLGELFLLFLEYLSYPENGMLTDIFDNKENHNFQNPFELTLATSDQSIFLKQ